MINTSVGLKISEYAKEYLLIFMTALFITSCTTVHQSKYFENIQKDTSIKKFIGKDADLKIKKGDILGIIVASITEREISVIGNPYSIPSGILVDDDGNIEMLSIGKIHAFGLTRNQLKDTLEKNLGLYLKNPVVSVKFLNHRVTIVGLVAHPQVFQMPEDNLTIFELLANAGEITSAGRWDNVRIVRDSDSGKIFSTINMKSASVFNSPNYYLKPGDIVYVEPKKVKVVVGQQTTQLVGLVLSAISVILIVVRGLQ